MQAFPERSGARARPIELPDAASAYAADSQLGQAIGRLASAPVSVMLIGEPGRGRRWAAGALHHRSGIAGPLLQLERVDPPGAGTGLDGLLAELPGTTIYVPDLRRLPACWQAALAEHAASGRGPRLLAAIDGDPQLAVARGELRRDLHDSLLPLPIPPLRQRVCDIEPTLAVLLRSLAERHGSVAPVISDIAAARLRAHPWPGDHAELEQLAERALVLGSLEAALRPLGRDRSGPASEPRRAIGFRLGLEPGR